MAIDSSAAAAAAAVAGAGGPVARQAAFTSSHFILDAPPTVYQTRLVDGKQDNATPQIFRVQLCAATFKAVVAADAPLSDVIFGVIRRADGREVEVFDEATASFLGLRVPQATFDYSLTKRGVLEIRVHRKELPVSIAHGFSPFKLIFAIGKSPAATELVDTAPFMIASKEPKPRAARPPPKRVRAPPPRRPVAAPAVGREAEINQMISGVAVAVTAPAAAPSAFQEEDDIDADVAVPRKRGRAVKAPAPIAVAPAPAAPSVIAAAPPSPVAAILGDSGVDAPDVAITDLPSPFGLDFDLGAAIAAEFAFGDAPMDAIVLPLAL